ncbi:MAG: hypothetical protein RR537_08555 [Longicatena sp.]
MKILVGSVMKADIIKATILDMKELSFTYEGKKGLNMIFSCESENEKQDLRLVKDKLKTVPELGGLFYNVSLNE